MIGNSWAVVTGGSDGIGLTMCKKLAREGFNICIISRSEKKINEKLEEIKKECRAGDDSFETLCVVADFWKLRTIAEYRTAIGDKLASLDVAVLVLCAGMLKFYPFVESSDDDVEKSVQINANHVVYTAKVMLKQLIDRYETKKVKSAVVVISSLYAASPVSGVTTYCAAKSFASYIAEALHFETEGKVDIMSYQPGFVATRLAGMSADKPEPGAITTEKAADTCFRDLGIYKMSRGAFVHEFMGWFFENVGKNFMGTICRDSLKQSKKMDDKVTAFQESVKKD